MFTVTIYADGGCRPNPGRGGFAAHLQTWDARGRQHERFISGGEAHTSTQRMELRAAVEGLEALTKPCRVTLNTPSNYVVDGVHQWLTRWVEGGWLNSNKRPPAHLDGVKVTNVF